MVLIALIGYGAFFSGIFSGSRAASTFEECIALGNPVMESYPRQCRDGKGNHVTEVIGNELEKSDLIRMETPRPNGAVGSPLTIRGEARGYWYFEASFPVVLIDEAGSVLAEYYATAQDEWMTESFVPFETMLTFAQQPAGSRGTLILKKDNPSGLSEHDDELRVPVVFE